MKRISHDEAKNHRQFPTGYLHINPHHSHHVVGFTLTPIDGEPGWEKVTYYGKKFVDPITNDGSSNLPHYIYILINPSVPGICKIGKTTTTVYDRVKQINQATGVIVPWEPVFSFPCTDCHSLERDIHEYLAARGVRVNPRREGFNIDIDSARSIVEKLGKKYKIESQ
jgi:hypothetical protein